MKSDETHPSSLACSLFHCICVRWCSIFRYERFNFRNSKENKNLSFPLLLLKALINWTTYNAPINCTYRQHKTKQKTENTVGTGKIQNEWVNEQKFRWNTVQWITNFGSFDQRTPFAVRKMATEEREREGKRKRKKDAKEMDQSFRSTSSYV